MHYLALNEPEKCYTLLFTFTPPDLYTYMGLYKHGETGQVHLLLRNQSCDRGITLLHKGFPILIPLDTSYVLQL